MCFQFSRCISNSASSLMYLLYVCAPAKPPWLRARCVSICANRHFPNTPQTTNIHPNQNRLRVQKIHDQVYSKRGKKFNKKALVINNSVIANSKSPITTGAFPSLSSGCVAKFDARSASSAVSFLIAGLSLSSPPSSPTPLC